MDRRTFIKGSAAAIAAVAVPLPAAPLYGRSPGFIALTLPTARELNAVTITFEHLLRAKALLYKNSARVDD